MPVSHTAVPFFCRGSPTGINASGTRMRRSCRPASDAHDCPRSGQAVLAALFRALVGALLFSLL